MQHDQTVADKLIDELIGNPSLFREQRKTYSLLQQFYDGLAFVHLHKLLSSENEAVLKIAFSITAELTDSQVEEFLDEAVANHNHPDRWIRHCAVSIIARATSSRRHEDFFYVLEHLEDRDPAVMADALSLFVSASIVKLEAGLSHFANAATGPAATHAAGLRKAIERPSMNLEPLRAMVLSKNPLEVMYGLGIAIRNRVEIPQTDEVISLTKSAFLSHIAEKIIRIRDKRLAKKRRV